MLEVIDLDTSVVVRLIMATPEDLFVLASLLLKETVAAGNLLHAGDVALTEAYFAL